MSEWHPDSCTCIINMDSNEFIKKCKIHTSSTVNDVKTHNQAINYKFGTGNKNFSKAELDEIANDKLTEKLKSML